MFPIVRANQRIWSLRERGATEDTERGNCDDEKPVHNADSRGTRLGCAGDCSWQ